MRTNAKVEAIDGQGVTIGGQKLSPRVRCSGQPACRPSGLTDRPRRSKPIVAGRIKVNNDCSVPGHPNVFVVGDMARRETAPGLLAARRRASCDSDRRARGPHDSSRSRRRAARPFDYTRQGHDGDDRQEPCGRADWPREAHRPNRLVRLAARPRVQLIGFRNRVAVLFGWAWNYMFSKREARSGITEKEWKLSATDGPRARRSRGSRGRPAGSGTASAQTPG